MSISAIQNVSFKGTNNQPAAFQDFREVKPYQTTTQPAAPRKTGGAFPALASYKMVGLGQYLDDRNKNARKYFLRSLGAIAATGIGIGIAGITGYFKHSIAGIIAGTLLATAGIAGSIVNKFQCVKDAYQGEKAPTTDTNA